MHAIYQSAGSTPTKVTDKRIGDYQQRLLLIRRLTYPSRNDMPVVGAIRAKYWWAGEREIRASDMQNATVWQV
jgi:hypothetical protein